MMRQKLLAEGLLSPERKRPAPRFPRAVGVITSAEGAAVQDIITLSLIHISHNGISRISLHSENCHISSLPLLVCVDN